MANNTRGTTVVDQIERLTDTVADQIVKRATLLDEINGDRPYGTAKITERQQVQRYAVMRDDEKAWKTLIEQHGKESVVGYALKLERLLEQYPGEQMPRPKDPLLMVDPQPQPTSQPSAPDAAPAPQGL